MSPINHFPGHFLIVDIGHPMTQGSVLLIKQSLQNILSLTCNIRDVSRIPVFGYGILAPSFQIVQQWKMLIGNFLTIDNNLNYLENHSDIGVKVTPRDYRSFLENSIENIVSDFEYYSNEWKLNTETKEKFNPLHYWPSQMQVTLITRKGGSLILEILKKYHQYSSKLQKLEIVEISSCEDKNPCILRNDTKFITYSIIKETVYDLDETFKRWILDDYSHCQQLQITSNNAHGFHVTCDINDCLINPALTTLPNTFSLSAISPTFTIQKPLHLPVNKQSIHEMEIVSKIGISDVCPSVLFGFPQWLYSTRTCITNWDEFRYNAEIFKALCAHLHTAEIGLLTRLKPSSRFNKITPLFFIISDGMRLLMRNIVPIELKLPQNPEQMVTSRAGIDIEEDANVLVHSLIGQIEMEKFLCQSPSIGVYEHFMEHLKSELKKNDGKRLKTGFELVRKQKRVKTSQLPDISPGEYIPKFLLQSKLPDKAAETIKGSVKTMKESQKRRKRNEIDPIHPALMSPGTMAKYRKHSSNYYEPPEVMEPGVLEKSKPHVHTPETNLSN